MRTDAVRSDNRPRSPLWLEPSRSAQTTNCLSFFALGACDGRPPAARGSSGMTIITYWSASAFTRQSFCAPHRWV